MKNKIKKLLHSYNTVKKNLSLNHLLHESSSLNNIFFNLPVKSSFPIIIIAIFSEPKKKDNQFSLCQKHGWSISFLVLGATTPKWKFFIVFVVEFMSCIDYFICRERVWFFLALPQTLAMDRSNYKENLVKNLYGNSILQESLILIPTRVKCLSFNYILK